MANRRLFMMLIACVFFAVGAQASLWVREDARHSEQWRRLYNEVPNTWKTQQDIKVRELPPRDMERLIADLEGGEADRHDDSIVDGCYQNESEDEPTPIITLSENLRGEQAALVFTHEYGHFVWNTILNDHERSRYTRIWRNQSRAHHLVTEYASDSEEEGFAEAFAYFLRKPTQLQRRDPASLRFLHDLSQVLK